jgi:hypothetical protein
MQKYARLFAEHEERFATELRITDPARDRNRKKKDSANQRFQIAKSDLR